MNRLDYVLVGLHVAAILANVFVLPVSRHPALNLMAIALCALALALKLYSIRRRSRS